MSKKQPLAENDWALFREQIGSVKPIHYDRLEPNNKHQYKRSEPIPRQTHQDEEQVLKDMLSDYFEPADLETGEELYYHSDGIQYAVLRKLRRGHFRISMELDLHGMNTEAARSALTSFLRSAKRDSINCVKVIHGKGKRSQHRGPVIKTKVNHWLQQREDVLAFCSARPNDGGTGAVYVLLKRP